eukprot:gene15010-21078_t
MAPAMLTGHLGLLGWYLIDLAINVVGWAVSAPLQTDRFYDAIGSASFQVLALGTLFVPGVTTSRKIFLTAAVMGWTIRLGMFLALRIYFIGPDSRFEELKKKPLNFLFAWVIQSVWVWVSFLPAMLVNLQDDTKELDYADIAGIVVFALGLATETVADLQKFVFKQKPANKGKFITSGLWSLSRHPNYAGEILVWWGIFAVCAVDFADSQPARFASVISPVFVMFLLCYGSGVPLLEKSAEKRWGGQEAYETYKQKTPILFPACDCWWRPSMLKEHEALSQGENQGSSASSEGGAFRGQEQAV